MDFPAERTVDARYLEPPQPFVETLEMLATLQPGEERNNFV